MVGRWRGGKKKRSAAARWEGSKGLGQGTGSLKCAGMGTTAAEALAATTARKVLKPMPASSWCHMLGSGLGLGLGSGSGSGLGLGLG